MRMQESGEMYLETILILSRQRDGVHAVDVGEYRKVSKPSVSRALGILRQGGYLTVGADDHIVLTDAGRAIAEKIYERHTLLKALLMRLGVSETVAAEDACRIEHDISSETFEAIKRHVKAL